MIELIYVGEAQTVQPGETVLFNIARFHSGCAERWDAGGGQVRLVRDGRFLVTFSANITIPEDGTPQEISLAITKQGQTTPGTVMRAFPGVVNRYYNVSTQTYVDVNRCCETIAITNTSTIPILVNDPNLGIVRAC